MAGFEVWMTTFGVRLNYLNWISIRLLISVQKMLRVKELYSEKQNWPTKKRRSRLR